MNILRLLRYFGYRPTSSISKIIRPINKILNELDSFVSEKRTASQKARVEADRLSAEADLIELDAKEAAVLHSRYSALVNGSPS